MPRHVEQLAVLSLELVEPGIGAALLRTRGLGVEPGGCERHGGAGRERSQETATVEHANASLLGFCVAAREWGMPHPAAPRRAASRIAWPPRRGADARLP